MDLLDRLYRKLREAAGRQYPATPSPSFTVAEVYQQLIPYRGVRGELGILELAEYEHALLRLLSGERGYLRMDVPQVQDEIRKELSSASPILGIYRDYAAVRVELLSHGDVPTVPERPRPSAPTASTPPFPADPVTVPVPNGVPAAVPVPAAADRCHSCQRPLPEEAELRYCPHCGADQRATPCAECGLSLRPEWNFCIRCGTPRGAGHRAP